MSPLELIGAFAALFSVVSAIVGLFVKGGKALQRLADHERRITRLEADDDAEDAARMGAGR